MFFPTTSGNISLYSTWFHFKKKNAPELRDVFPYTQLPLLSQLVSTKHDWVGIISVYDAADAIDL